MSDKVKIFTDENFEEEVLKSDKLVVVDFWAVWCVPCKMIAPAIEQLAEEYPDVKVGKLDVDENQQTAIRYGIMSIPTVGFFKNGQLVDSVVGAVPKQMLEAVLKKHL